mmetsp:Transcript_25217/g.37194  ORF Transcript_25217/g.37194 Transcript_25217/m.37194 type:complete len:1132 (-) Transcript_25217:403-3798(-)
MQFPLLGSASLFGLYCAFKFFDKETVNLIISVYFSLVGVAALTATLGPTLESVGPKFLAKEIRMKHFLPESIGGKSPWVFNVSDIFALMAGIAFNVAYFQTKHWTMNNVLGICFCLQGIERFSLGTYKIGAILLVGLFFYDIFWVFGTDVMVTVAKSLDGPIKILFPRSLIPDAATGKLEMSLLGLGDIVIPGFFLALLLRFDAHNAKVDYFPTNVHASFPKPYFHSALVGYVLGLATTLYVMIVFQAAQPALLYLVPACLGSSLLCAVVRRELKALFDYSEEEEEEEEEEEVIERPSKICRLDGCTKLKQYNCDGYCMRHYRQYVLEGQQKEEEEKEEDEAKEEVEEEEEVQEEEAVEEEEETSEKDEEKEEVTEEDEEKEDITEEDEENKEEVTEEEKVKEEDGEEVVEEEEVEGEEEEEKAETIAEDVKEEKTRVCKYAECNKYKQYNCDGYCMRHYRHVVLEGGAAEKEEEKEEEVETEKGDDVAVGGDVAEDEAVPDGAKSISPAPTSESSPAKVEKDEDMVETQNGVSEKKKPAQRTFPAPPTLEEAAAAGCKKCRLEFETGEKTRKTHNDKCPRKWKSAGKPPPGIPAPTAGRKKRVQSPARSSQSMEEDESAVAALVAVAAATANTRRSDRSAVTPKAEESSTRIRRERKKPTVYSPQEGVPDREWQPDGSSTSPQKKVGKKTEKKDEVPVPPKPKRGRPSRADIAAREAYAAYVAKSKSPPPKERRKPGPKPKKEKEKDKKPPPKKASPPKKGPVIKPDTEGVGVLNRLPGTLFDCSACLDINKIKLCCYCACRVCFNKFGKERTILCDKCDQEYHTFCVGLDKIPEGEWVCIACIEDEKKQKILAQRRKEREARKKIEDEKRALEEAKKAVLAAERKKKFAEKKAIENEKKRVASEQRRIAAEKRRIKDAELRAHGIPIKRGPGRPRKDEQRLLAALAQQPQKRGRGRPRKDGKDPIPRKYMSKYEISAENVYFDEESELTAAQRSRSGRKIQRTIFHDEVDHPGLMKKARTDEYMGGYEKGAAAAGRGSGKSASGKKEGRRKPGARECMQLTKKFDATPIDEQSFDVLMDYSKRGKVDHLIRMRERLDDHSRFLEAQLAGLEALVQEKGELNIVCPPKSD